MFFGENVTWDTEYSHLKLTEICMKVNLYLVESLNSWKLFLPGIILYTAAKSISRCGDMHERELFSLLCQISFPFSIEKGKTWMKFEDTCTGILAVRINLLFFTGIKSCKVSQLFPGINFPNDYTVDLSSVELLVEEKQWLHKNSTTTECKIQDTLDCVNFSRDQKKKVNLGSGAFVLLQASSEMGFDARIFFFNKVMLLLQMKNTVANGYLKEKKFDGFFEGLDFAKKEYLNKGIKVLSHSKFILGYSCSNHKLQTVKESPTIY